MRTEETFGKRHPKGLGANLPDALAHNGDQKGPGSFLIPIDPSS
jgi:hypothetical protein